MSKISKELIEFKKLLEEDEIETYKNETIEELNLDFLIDYVYENEYILEDNRHYGYTLHSLESILLIVIFAMLSNCNTYKEIELFIRVHYEWLIKKLKLDFGIPSISTIRRVISMIKPKELENLCNEIFFEYVREKDDIYDDENLRIVDIYSLDGKTANGSEVNTTKGLIKKINAMSAYSVKYNKTLATEFIDAKTNEIPTCPKLLSRVNIKDVVITFDALNTQEKTLKFINDNKGHYVVPIKDNHKDFAEELKVYFNDLDFLNKSSKYTKTEKSHNQIERREYYFTNDINWINNKEKWNGKGYPDGKKENQIPFAARIMAIADVFDAVSAKRCYRDALPLETCFKIIQDGSETDFDPELVKCFFHAKDKIVKVYNESNEK